VRICGYELVQAASENLGKLDVALSAYPANASIHLGWYGYTEPAQVRALIGRMTLPVIFQGYTRAAPAPDTLILLFVHGA
jgi:hypothetical protein